MMPVLRGTTAAWILTSALAVTLIIMSRFARPFIYMSGDVDIYQSIGESVWSGAKSASRRTVAVLCAGCAVALLTNWIYLPLYLNLVEKQDLLPTFVLNLRNALLLVFAWLCYRASVPTSRSTSAG